MMLSRCVPGVGDGRGPPIPFCPRERQIWRRRGQPRPISTV